MNHFGQLPSVTISFNLAPGLALGDAVAAGLGALALWLGAGAESRRPLG